MRIVAGQAFSWSPPWARSRSAPAPQVAQSGAQLLLDEPGHQLLLGPQLRAAGLEHLGRITACCIMAIGLLTLAVVTAQVASSFVAQGPSQTQRDPQPGPALPEVTLAELDRRLARIEELLTTAGPPSLPAAEAPEGRQTLTLRYQAKINDRRPRLEARRAGQPGFHHGGGARGDQGPGRSRAPDPTKPAGQAAPHATMAGDS